MAVQHVRYGHLLPCVAGSNRPNSAGRSILPGVTASLYLFRDLVVISVKNNIISR
jgi:hypothetical protein